MCKTNKLPLHLSILGAIVALVAGATVTVAPTAAADDITATVFTAPNVEYVNLRNGPGLDHERIGQLDAGASVTLVCWSSGTSVTSPFEGQTASTIWYKVAGYPNAWISDAYLYTGSDQPVTSQCSDSESSLSTENATQQKYNGTVAAQWAKDHLEDPDRFEEGGDCTWYVSQALWAGGLPRTRIWDAVTKRLGPRGAYLTYSEVTPTARLAHEFTNYLVDRGLATKQEVIDWADRSVMGANIGDVIVYDFNADGTIDHATIVTAIGPDGVVKVTQHGPSLPDKPWDWSSTQNTWLKSPEAKPNTKAYLLRITY